MNDAFPLVEMKDADLDLESVSAYIMDDGEIIEAKDLVVKKASKKNKIASNSIDTDEDEFGEQYRSGRVYRPVLNFKNMTEFSMENPFHLRCINQKSIDACGGWDIKNVDRRGLPVNDNKKKKIKENKLFEFFENCGMNGDDFIEISKKIIIDYETFSFATVELIRNKKGEPCKLVHMPAQTCRIARSLSLKGYEGETDQKFIVQIVNNHERVYKIFDGESPGILEPNTKNPMTEVLFIRGYHVSGGKYGIPQWVTSLKSMVGYDKVAEYNINFFSNEAVPRFAVIVQGGKLDTEEKNLIRNYFKTDLKGVKNAHKTLVLTTGKGAEVKLVPLATEMQEGSFRFYRKDNRDEIITAHGVPPHRIQVYDSGSSGTYSPSSLFELDKAYKYSIIVPLQRKIASMFNQIIKLGFKVSGKGLVYDDLDIGEEKQNAEILKVTAAALEKHINTGAMTIDEVREQLKLLRYNDMENVDEETKEWARTPRPIFIIHQQRQQQMQQAMQSVGIGNDGVNNLNQTANEFDEKSKEVTERNQQEQLSEQEMNTLVME